MMETETVSEKLDCNSIFTRMVNQEDFIAFSHHKSLHPYTPLPSQIIVRVKGRGVESNW
jgi:hypothetical protein